MVQKMEIREDMHIEDGVLLALIDGELALDEHRRAETHADGCSECAARRDAMRFESRRVTAALEAEDVPVPFAEMPDALREAYERAPTPISSAPSGSRRHSSRSVLGAAALILVFAAGAYAIPGSPLRGWIDGGIEGIAGLVRSEEAPVVDAGPAEVSVQPVNDAVQVSVVGAPAGLRITISLSDEPTAAASAREADFHLLSGVIEVTDASGELAVTLPRSVGVATVEVDGIEVARAESGRLTRSAGADASDAEILLQTGG